MRLRCGVGKSRTYESRIFEEYLLSQVPYLRPVPGAFEANDELCVQAYISGALSLVKEILGRYKTDKTHQIVQYDEFLFIVVGVIRGIGKAFAELHLGAARESKVSDVSLLPHGVVKQNYAESHRAQFVRVFQKFGYPAIFPEPELPATMHVNGCTISIALD